MEDPQEMLDEFVQWQAEKKISGNDLSPQAFLIDRAKEQALQALVEIQEESENFDQDNEHELIGYAKWVIGKLHDI